MQGRLAGSVSCKAWLSFGRFARPLVLGSLGFGKGESKYRSCVGVSPRLLLCHQLLFHDARLRLRFHRRNNRSRIHLLIT